MVVFQPGTGRGNPDGVTIGDGGGNAVMASPIKKTRDSYKGGLSCKSRTRTKAVPLNTRSSPVSR